MNPNSGQQPRLAVPRSTALLAEQFGERCQNLGLLLDKFVPLEAIGEGKLQAAWFKGKLLPNQRQNTQLWEARRQRWQGIVQAAGALTFTAALSWRMVVGLGGQTVLETDLTLDHLSGLPIIPGSALKGLTRAYAALEKTTPPSPTLETDQNAPDVLRIFGDQTNAGTVNFFDVLPLPPSQAASVHLPGGTSPKFRITVDIMNPHYPDYYRDGGHTAPSNDQSPVPVYFLTVEGAAFEFAVAPRREADRQDAQMALGWLKEAVQKYGVGGKTSAGYGAFRLPEEPATPSITEEQIWAWIGRKRTVTGVVETNSKAGAILKLDDPVPVPNQLVPRGLLLGQSKPEGMKLTCRVMGVREEQGELFVQLSI